jgi:tetratricopeptide (TPR) repeat protein
MEICLSKEESMKSLTRNTWQVLAIAFALFALPIHAQTIGAGDSSAGAEELAARAEKLLDEYQSDEDQDKLANAEKAIAASLAKQPASHALVEKARLLMIKGKESPESLAAAELLLQGARNRDFNYGRAYVLRGYVLTRMGNMGEAGQAFFTAKRLVPNDPSFLLNYADFQDKMGDIDGARQSREQLVGSGMASRQMLYAAHVALLQTYERAANREKADASFAALTGLITNTRQSAFIRGDYAQSLILYFVDFEAGERRAREALAIMDYPHARGTLSLALYGRWAEAKRDRKDPKVVAALLKEAQANDPDGRDVPSCALETESLAFLRKSLAEIGIPPDNSRHNC